MKRILALALAANLFGIAHATSDADARTAGAQAAIQELGKVNGIALACQQKTAAGEARLLMLRHAPKSRQYGEAFENATNAAFLEQGKDTEHCPSSANLATRLTDLSTRLQTVLPIAP